MTAREAYEWQAAREKASAPPLTAREQLEVDRMMLRAGAVAGMNSKLAETKETTKHEGCKNIHT